MKKKIKQIEESKENGKVSWDKMQIGGQAVIEGVMMRSPRWVTIAVRKSSGKIVLKKEPYISLTKKYRFLNLPIVRGAIALAETLYIGIKALTFSAEVFAEEEEGEEGSEKSGKNVRNERKEQIFTGVWLSLSVAMGVFLALLLFFYLPLFLTGLLGIVSGFLFNLVEGIIRISIFLLYLWIITSWKSMRRIFEYHGAEHKSIFTLEAGEELTVENVKKYTTRHPRCGTSFILIVMLVSIAVFIFLGKPHTLAERLIRLAFVPLIAGISYEIIKLSARKRDNFFVKALVVPGLWLQKLTTKEPDEKQLEVAIVALKSALDK